MGFGSRLLLVRKNKGMSQDDLARRRGITGAAIRDEMKPSIEVAAKIAQILEVSLDWMIGHIYLELDDNMIQWIQEDTQMNPKDKEHVLATLGAFIRQNKLQNIIR